MHSYARGSTKRTKRQDNDFFNNTDLNSLIDHEVPQAKRKKHMYPGGHTRVNVERPFVVSRHCEWTCKVTAATTHVPDAATSDPAKLNYSNVQLCKGLSMLTKPIGTDQESTRSVQCYAFLSAVE